MASIAGLLLAAGESTRMGEPKALLPWQGKTLVEHQVAALTSAGLSQIVTVLGHQSERLEALLRGWAGVRCIYNPDYQQGKTTSIMAGLRALCQSWDGSPSATHETGPGTSQEEAILLLNVDQPRSADTIRRIMELHFRKSRGGFPVESCLITIPTYQGKGGHPIILSTSLMSELVEISEQTLGLKAVVLKHEGETQRVEIDSPEILLDLNTPKDYQMALEMFSTG